jgi:predicted alpha/beta superfamily hydrolase
MYERNFMKKPSLFFLLILLLGGIFHIGTIKCLAQSGDPVSSTDQSMNGVPPKVTLENTELKMLYSKQVNIGYKLYISLPKGYKESQKTYPVVYLLDADYSFAIAKNIADHLAERNNLAELILVGIAYDGPEEYRLNSTRDYTPTRSRIGGYGPEYQKYSGGGEKFKAFIRDELVPFIDANYRTTPERTLVGHSYGGLFGSWVAFTTPELFSNYILISPSLRYDNWLMFRLEEKFAVTRKDKELPIKLFLSAGSRETNAQQNVVEDLEKFYDQVTARDYSRLAIQMMVFDDETHNSIFPAALTRGLRFIYGTGSWAEAN